MTTIRDHAHQGNEGTTCAIGDHVIVSGSREDTGNECRLSGAIKSIGHHGNHRLRIVLFLPGGYASKAILADDIYVESRAR